VQQRTILISPALPRNILAAGVVVMMMMMAVEVENLGSFRAVRIWAFRRIFFDGAR